jgi:hypothetical protein
VIGIITVLAIYLINFLAVASSYIHPLTGSAPWWAIFIVYVLPVIGGLFVIAVTVLAGVATYRYQVKKHS